MVKLQNVNKYYQSGSERIHAIKNLNITFPDKGLVFILGPSGCGKSTLLNMLGGLDKPDDGAIYIEDRDLKTFSNSDLNNYLNSYLGFVFQEYNILKDLNLYQNISLPLEMQNYPKKEIKERVDNILVEVGLDAYRKRKINQLSGGQRQRIAIARALIKDPKMIIADEPTGNLDAATSESIFEIFKKLANDRLIIIVSHDEESAYKYGDRIIHISDGELVKDTNPALSSEKASELVLKKAKVPMSTSIKLSLKNVWKKRFRFLVMTIICALSLAFLSFTLELSNDKLRQNVYTSVEAGYTYTTIQKATKLPDDYVKTSFYDDYIGNSLPINSYETIKQNYPNLTVHQYQNVNINLVGKDDERQNNFYRGSIEYLVKYDASNHYELVAGRLPKEGYHEVLITDYLASMFEYYNLYGDVANYTDYLGKYIQISSDSYYKITGILKTEYQKWSQFSKEPNVDTSYKLNYPYTNDYKMMNAIYLTESDFDVEKSLNNPNIVKLNDYVEDFEIKYNTSSSNVKEYSFTSIEQTLIQVKWLRWGKLQKYDIGRMPASSDEVVIPLELARTLFTGISLNLGNAQLFYNEFLTYINNKEITLSIYNKNTDSVVEKVYKVVGLTNNSNVIMSDNAGVNDLFQHFNEQNEFLMAELPENKESAYQLFNQVYDNGEGYILDVWAYRADIDSFTVDPFIDLLSKVGLFVFAVFTIGILWTIITIDIVDSKKEIGIFRSIGLSGFKVSLIFIFQTLIVCLLAYGIALVAGNYAINLYNGTLMDDLNLIHLSMYMMTYRSPIFLLIFLAVITTIAMFVPLYKIMSQKIIDVISERDSL
ncbi:MAG: ABC transporter ATP-binding protein/permease [Bacilli bacterium]|nr:ABC transporter ATP-binding protein/permease [Bacilli bacterium]